MTETDRRKLSKVKARSIKIRKLRKKPLIEKGIQAKVLEFFWKGRQFTGDAREKMLK